MAVRKEVTVQHGFSQEEIAEAVKATLLPLWGYEERSPGTFESDIGMTSWLSYGERFTVDVTREGIIKAVSESKFPTQLFDFAKNRENLKSFFNRLKHTFSTSGLAKSKPEAYASFISNESTHIRSLSPGEVILIWITIMILAGGVALVLVVALLFVTVFSLATLIY